MNPKVLTFAVLLAAAACAAPPSARVANDVWPMYQRSADHNAVLERGSFRRSWAFDTKAKINGSLSVAGDTVFATTFAGELLALDLRTGKRVWSAKAGNVLMTTPIVGRGSVYVGSGRNGALPSSVSPHESALSGELWGVPKGDAVLSFDARSGARKWSFHTLGEDMPSAALYRNVLVFANGDAHAYGLDAASGAVIWQRTLPGIDTMASAAIGGGTIYVSTCNLTKRRLPSQTIALDPETGRELWTAPYGNCDSSPAYAGGSVYVSGIDIDSRYRSTFPRVRAFVASLDARTGRPQWVYRSADYGLNTDISSAERAVAGTYNEGSYYQAIPSHDQIVAFDARTGRARWTYKTIGPVKMSPIVYRGRVYAGDITGVFYILDRRTGAALAAPTSRNPFSTSSPVIVGQTMLLVNGNIIDAIPLDVLAKGRPQKVRD